MRPTEEEDNYRRGAEPLFRRRGSSVHQAQSGGRGRGAVWSLWPLISRRLFLEGLSDRAVADPFFPQRSSSSHRSLAARLHSTLCTTRPKLMAATNQGLRKKRVTEKRLSGAKIRVWYVRHEFKARSYVLHNSARLESGRYRMRGLYPKHFHKSCTVVRTYCRLSRHIDIDR